MQRPARGGRPGARPGGSRRALVQHQRRQPLLRAPHPAPRRLPAQRRIRTAGRSAGGGGSAAPGRPHRQARGTRGDRRLDRLELPPGLPSPHRPGLSARGMVRRGGAGANGALLPAPARRRDGRPPAGAAPALPDLQRLHHRSPKRIGVGMLPARRLLQTASGARDPGEAQARPQRRSEPGFLDGPPDAPAIRWQRHHPPPGQ